MNFVKRRHDGLLIFEREGVYFGMSGVEVYTLPLRHLMLLVKTRLRKLFRTVKQELK